MKSADNRLISRRFEAVRRFFVLKTSWIKFNDFRKIKHNYLYILAQCSFISLHHTSFFVLMAKPHLAYAAMTSNWLILLGIQMTRYTIEIQSWTSGTGGDWSNQWFGTISPYSGTLSNRKDLIDFSIISSDVLSLWLPKYVLRPGLYYLMRKIYYILSITIIRNSCKIKLWK